MDSLATQIERLYHAAFDRPSDAEGLAYWVNSGWSTSQIATWFSSSPELVARYGALSDDGYVHQLYRNILGREGEATGINYWDNALAQGVISRGDTLNLFAQSPENIMHIAAPVAPPPPMATPVPIVMPPPPAAVPPPVTMPPPATIPPTPDTVPPPATIPPTPDTVPPVAIPGNINTPTLSITGFQTIDTISNVDQVIVGSDPNGPTPQPNGNLVVGNLVNVGKVVAFGNVGSAHTVFSTYVEVQHDYGNTAFDLKGAFDPFVALDHVDPAGLGNAITFGPHGGRLEIGDFAFDGASYSGTKVTLTDHGTAVYSLNNVTGAAGVTAVHNPGTGHDFISVPSTG